MAELNAKQAAFVREYLVDLNASQAALRAGYSKKTAGAIGHELLQKPDVQEAVSKALKARSDRVDIKADDVLQELDYIARADPAGMWDKDGGLLPLRAMPEALRRAIASIEDTEYGQRVKFWDKPKALELLGKHLELFTDRVKHSGEVVTVEIIRNVKKA